MPEERPRVVIFAGPNGSGKSTLTRRLQSAPEFSFPPLYINADDLARDGSEATQEDRERAAFRRARALRQTYREQGVSFAFETVFSHPSNLLDFLHLKRAGYTVVLFFVATADSRLNVLRVQSRVQAGGHAVPADKITDRYERALRFLPRAVEIADEAYVYDNSDRLQLAALAENGVLLSGAPPLPEYLQARLAAPLIERAEDRRRFGEHLAAGEMLDAPEERGGVYTGMIRAVLPWYVLQADSAAERVIRWHDRSLLTVIPTTTHGTMTYKEGYGDWQDQPLPAP